MKRMLFCLTLALRCTTAAERGSVATDVGNTLTEFSRLENYSWTATVSHHVTSAIPLMVIEGKAQKDGPTSISIKFGERTIEGYVKGGKAYVTSPNRKWRSVAGMKAGESPGAFMTRLIRSIKPPAQEIEILLKDADRLKRNGDAISGQLSGSAASTLVESRRRPGRKDETKSASGDVTFWTTNGSITKYEVSIRGKVNVDGKDSDVDRTTVVEIKDVGTTKVTLPESARKRLG